MRSDLAVLLILNRRRRRATCPEERRVMRTSRLRSDSGRSMTPRIYYDYDEMLADDALTR